MMPVSTDNQIFGPQGDPGVEVGLPFDLAGRKLTSHNPVSNADRAGQRLRDVDFISHLVEVLSKEIGEICGRQLLRYMECVESQRSKDLHLLEVSIQQTLQAHYKSILMYLITDQEHSIDIAMYKSPGDIAGLQSTMVGALQNHGSTATS